LTLPDHLRFNIRVIDSKGGIVAVGRDLLAAKRAARAHGRDIASAGKGDAPSAYRRWEFGDIPAERVVERRGLRFSVYPTLRDLGISVQVVEASDPVEAEASLRHGVLRLAMLALPEQLKYARKQFADNRNLVLLSQGVERSRPLADALAERCFAECFLQPGVASPRTADQFQAMLDQGRAQFGEVVDRTVAQVLDVMREWRTVRLRLEDLGAPAFRGMTDEVRYQLTILVPDAFPADVPEMLWPHLPRYLKALARRLDKVQGNLKRDAELASRVVPFVREWQRLATHPERPTSHPELDRLQWMIEEYRVSLFAQDLRTVLPVSDKRLQEQLDRSRAEARAA
jgi:ATP-dependent helicase HrpA